MTPPQMKASVCVDWLAGDDGDVVCLGVSCKDVVVGRTMACFLVAVARCKCVLTSAWNNEEITLPKDVNQVRITDLNKSEASELLLYSRNFVPAILISLR